MVCDLLVVRGAVCVLLVGMIHINQGNFCSKITIRHIVGPVHSGLKPKDELLPKAQLVQDLNSKTRTRLISSVMMNID